MLSPHLDFHAIRIPDLDVFPTTESSSCQIQFNKSEILIVQLILQTSEPSIDRYENISKNLVCSAYTLIFMQLEFLIWMFFQLLSYPDASYYSTNQKY